MRHFFGLKSRVEVDECPNCAGYWLDSGELTKIKEEHTRAASEAAARQPALSSQTIRHLYRLRTEGRSAGGQA
jgi:Zn-finger nucleic acid-binding protein